MRMKRLEILLFAASAAAATWAQAPIGAAFSYQGHLKYNNAPFDGAADFTFKMYNAAVGGTQIGADLLLSAVPVHQGLFAAQLDFGSAAYDGNDRWLEVWVRVSGGGPWTVFSQRQPLTAAPYAVYALKTGPGVNADTLDSFHASASPAAGTLLTLNSSSKFPNSVFYTGAGFGLDVDLLDGQHGAFYQNATNLISGTLPSARLLGTYASALTFSNTGNSFSGNGAGLTALNAASVASGTLADARLSSNVALLNAAQTFTANKYFTGIVGIGTTSPVASLDARSGIASTPAIQAYHTATSDDTPAIRGDHQVTAGRGVGVQGNGGYVGVYGASTTGWGGYFDGKGYFAGDVGIGTSTPTTRLTLQTPAGSYGLLHTDGTIGLGTFVGGAGNGGYIGTRSNHSLHFFTNDSAARMTINTNGQVGIGTTAPDNRLVVYGGTGEGYTKMSGGTLNFNGGSDGFFDLFSDGGASGGLRYYGSGGLVARINNNRTVTVNTSSDVNWAQFYVRGEPTGDEYAAIEGSCTGVGVRGAGGFRGVWGSTNSSSGVGVYGSTADPVNGKAAHFEGPVSIVGPTTVGGDTAIGVYAYGRDRAVEAISAEGFGVYGHSTGGIGVFGHTTDPVYGQAGHFEGPVGIVGPVGITGSLTVFGTKLFQIDHPFDPENKYLSHACVESDEVTNMYTGNVVTDERGYATVRMPDWFEAINRNFRYQLTVIDEADTDGFVQAKVVRGVANNEFTFRTSAPHAKVSWQVTAIRNDAYAKAHPFVVESDKPERERGSYQMPELYGYGRERSTSHALGRDPLPDRHSAERERHPRPDSAADTPSTSNEPATHQTPAQADDEEVRP